MATQVESPILDGKVDRLAAADEGVIPIQSVTSENSVPAVEESQAERTSARGEEGSRSEGTAEGQSGEAEEEEECGFCLFMKGGPCGQRFSLWQDCVESAEKSEKDIVEECAQLTTLLKVCMEMHPQYYGPILDAEKAMEREVNSAEAGGGTQASPGAESETSKYAEVPDEGGGESQSESDPATVKATEVLSVVLDNEGEVQEAWVGTQAISGAESETSKNAEVPGEGGGESQSESEPATVKATEVLSVVLDDEGEVQEVIDEVRFTVPPKSATEASTE